MGKALQRIFSPMRAGMELGENFWLYGTLHCLRLLKTVGFVMSTQFFVPEKVIAFICSAKMVP